MKTNIKSNKEWLGHMDPVHQPVKLAIHDIIIYTTFYLQFYGLAPWIINKLWIDKSQIKQAPFRKRHLPQLYLHPIINTMKERSLERVG